MERLPAGPAAPRLPRPRVGDAAPGRRGNPLPAGPELRAQLVAGFRGGRARHHPPVDAASVELQVLLEGAPLPNERSTLVRYALRQGASGAQVGMLRRLPDRKFRT